MAAACRFRVLSVSVERDERGNEMRRVRLMASSGHAFQPTPDQAKSAEPAAPSGEISMRVNPEFAKKFQLGEEVTTPFMEND
jgi:hypothetical protein